MQLNNAIVSCRINAGNFKTHLGILNKVSAVLYGQLEGYICHSNSRVSEQWYAKGVRAEQREAELGEFLSFLGTLLASGGQLCAAMAMERLASMLLKVAGVDPSLGKPVVSSLKTRLLALQVMEMVVCEPGEEGFGDLSKCVEVSVVVEDEGENLGEGRGQIEGSGSCGEEMVVVVIYGVKLVCKN